jgi:hypothetical protein
VIEVPTCTVALDISYDWTVWAALSLLMLGIMIGWYAARRRHLSGIERRRRAGLSR